MNPGSTYQQSGRKEARADNHEHLDHAQKIFARLKDGGSVAQVNDTRARVLLDEGRNEEAEQVARSAVRALEKGGAQAILAEALSCGSRKMC